MLMMTDYDLFKLGVFDQDTNSAYTYDAYAHLTNLRADADGLSSVQDGFSIDNAGHGPYSGTADTTTWCAYDYDVRYYGYRYYSPSLGRWLSRDPIEDQIIFNLYGFIDNDPTDYVDTDGRAKSGGGKGGGSDNGGGTKNVPLWVARGSAASPNSIMCVGGGVGICVRGATDAIDEKCILPCVKRHEICHARQAAPYSPCVGKTDGAQVGINPEYPNSRHIFACSEVDCHREHIACLQGMYNIPECKCAVIPEMNRVMQNLRSYISECGR